MQTWHPGFATPLQQPSAAPLLTPAVPDGLTGEGRGRGGTSASGLVSAAAPAAPGVAAVEASVPAPPSQLDGSAASAAPLLLELDSLVPASRPLSLDALTVGTVNGDTWAGARAVGEWLQARGRRPDILFVQEARFFDAEAVGSAHQWCARQGMQLAQGPVQRTGAGRMAVSGGVGIAVANSIALGQAVAIDDVWAHRVIVRRAHFGDGATLLLLSLYLVTSIGLAGENMDILEYVSGLVGQFSEPFLIGADWNVEPEVLLASRWVDQIGGVLLASDSPTCGTSEYDYFVASSFLSHRAEEPAACFDTPVGTHSCVLMRLQNFWTAPMVWVEDTRRAFCLPKSREAFLKLQAPAEALEAETAELAEPLIDLGMACSRWFDLAERHLVKKLEVDSASIRHYLGRGRGIKMVQRPLSELHVARQRKLDTSGTEAWAGFQRCWRALRRWGQAKPGSRARRQVLHDRLVEQASALELPPAISEAPALVRGTRLQWLGLASRNSPLANWFDGLLDDEVGQRRRADAAQRAKDWRAFCAESLGGPGRVAHRLIKQKRGEAQAVEEPGDLRHLPQVGSAAAEAILNEWLSLWIKPSREAEEAASQWQVHASLPPITTDQVRDVARRFPLQTGLGWDNFHPRSLLLLSEALLERFVAILNRWEQSPVMVDLWLTIMVFLPKPPPQLGRRPGGLH